MCVCVSQLPKVTNPFFIVSSVYPTRRTAIAEEGNNNRRQSTIYPAHAITPDALCIPTILAAVRVEIADTNATALRQF